jgi:hypothetical protein
MTKTKATTTTLIIAQRKERASETKNKISRGLFPFATRNTVPSPAPPNYGLMLSTQT